jgi:hypothetical protein
MFRRYFISVYVEVVKVLRSGSQVISLEALTLGIATDLLKALLGSSPVGTFQRLTPRNSTVEMSSCPRMGRCCTRHEQ